MSLPVRIHEDVARRIWAARLERPYRFTTPVPGQGFALLLVVADPSVDVSEQAALSSQWVEQGCRWAFCAGHACSSWDDSIDWAYLERCDYEPRDEDLVMTTWHENQPLAEVAWQFLFLRQSDDFSPREYVVLSVGGDESAHRGVVTTVLETLRAEA